MAKERDYRPVDGRGLAKRREEPSMRTARPHTPQHNATTRFDGNMSATAGISRVPAPILVSRVRKVAVQGQRLQIPMGIASASARFGGRVEVWSTECVLRALLCESQSI
ncbi:hypothetical protein CGCSCA1_v002103 [Colletotrichum siamense]|nr:hypothetical protein CGCSCA1_v002103 [Colletotrichum siamense]